MNFILEKSSTYCTNAHSYFEKGNKYISTYKSQRFKEDYDLCWAACGPQATGLTALIKEIELGSIVSD